MKRFKVIDINSNLFGEIVKLSNVDDKGFYEVKTSNGKFAYFEKHQLQLLEDGIKTD